jgi:hypothetical protein
MMPPRFSTMLKERRRPRLSILTRDHEAPATQAVQHATPATPSRYAAAQRRLCATPARNGALQFADAARAAASAQHGARSGVFVKEAAQTRR